MKNILLLTISLFIFMSSGCELVRDNPLDGNATQVNAQDLPLIEFSKFEVNTDSNNDNVINKGESIKLKVFLKNNGASRANKVKATISTSSSYISNLSPTGAISYNYNYSDYIDPNSEATPSYTSEFPSFNVSNTTPDNTTITFTIDITDESDNTWTDSFTITVQ